MSRSTSFAVARPGPQPTSSRHAARAYQVTPAREGHAVGRDPERQSLVLVVGLLLVARVPVEVALLRALQLRAALGSGRVRGEAQLRELRLVAAPEARAVVRVRELTGEKVRDAVLDREPGGARRTHDHGLGDRTRVAVKDASFEALAPVQGTGQPLQDRGSST